MKTYINHQSKKAKQFMFLLCTSFVMLAGCEKAEVAQLSDTNDSSSELKKELLPPPAYTMLVIEHNSMASSLPDYDVYLRSDGSVTYRGWSNVFYKGTAEFKADAATVSYIKNLFESANIFNIQMIPFQHDDPFTATTYRNLVATKTIIDYDEGIPQILIQIRKKAEQKLGIARFVEGPKYTATPVSNI